MIEIKDIIKDSKTKESRFLIASKNLDKMKEAFFKTESIIRKALSESRFIVIRHHNDVDGYTAGFVLEKALNSIGYSRNIMRSSSRTPFYDYTDALRDLNNFLSSRSSKPPLVILTDLGSNEQSIASIKRLKAYNIDFVIIDHHRYDKENETEALSFLNPHVFGLGSDLNAGALATELALLLDPKLNGIKHLPGLSGVADKSSGEDVESYIKLSGYSRKELEKWAVVIDHETYYLKFPERTEILEDLFIPGKKNTQLISYLSTKIEGDMEIVRKATKKYSKIENLGKFKLIIVEKNKISDWEYASSKIIAIAHDLVEGPKITLAFSDDSLSYRADGVKFSGVNLLEKLKNEFPAAMLSGGGHDAAGGIRFNIASGKEILEYIKNHIKKI
ncbi:MAG: DHH family phosphoesterase [Nanoarchaeota archaeon]